MSETPSSVQARRRERRAPRAERAGGRDGDLSVGPPLATPERIAAVEAAAARVEGEIQHLRDTMGHVDELTAAVNRHRRLRTLITLLQREKHAVEARQERERQDQAFEAAAEKTRAATAALLEELGEAA